jgi:hypothetical protein
MTGRARGRNDKVYGAEDAFADPPCGGAFVISARSGGKRWACFTLASSGNADLS